MRDGDLRAYNVGYTMAPELVSLWHAKTDDEQRQGIGQMPFTPLFATSAERDHLIMWIERGITDKAIGD